MGGGSSFSGVVLAGGRSSRMGRDKAFLTLENGTTLLQKQIDLLQSAGVEEIYISGRKGTEYGPLSRPVLIDERLDQGPLGGVLAALRRMRESHLMVLAVDMPCIEKKLLETLMRMTVPGKGVVPVVEGFYEPLAACYPKAILPLVEKRMQEQLLGLQPFLEIARIAGLMNAFEVPEEDRALFCNWNRPGDFFLRWETAKAENGEKTVEVLMEAGKRVPIVVE